MFKSSFALITIFLVIFRSCSTDPDKQPQDISKIILFDEINSVEILKDPANITEVTFDGNNIHIKVSYSGGCEKHQFLLYGLKYFMESYPVQAAVYLSHNANNDACEAFITKKIVFDLSPLMQEYKESYNDNGPIILRLYAPGIDQSFEPMPVYAFD